jgi:hypothetical protein
MLRLERLRHLTLALPLFLCACPAGGSQPEENPDAGSPPPPPPPEPATPGCSVIALLRFHWDSE